MSEGNNATGGLVFFVGVEMTYLWELVYIIRILQHVEPSSLFKIK